MEFNYITRGNSKPSGRPQVYFTGHPQDYAAFLAPFAGDLLDAWNCTVYYDTQPEAAWDEEELYGKLEQMKLFVIPVTRQFLCEKNRALEVEFPFAIQHHIPVLPVALEEGLETLFNQKCGDLQLLWRGDAARDEKLRAGNVLSYKEKLKKRMSSILVGDELAEKIRAAFDAYIFLSYRKKDRAYAQKLMRMIHKNRFCRDIAIWYDEFLNPGEDFSDAIAQALEKSSLFTMAVTPSLLEENNYVMMQEYPRAREVGKPILPVEMKPTNWDLLHEKYEDLPVCVNTGNEKNLSDALLENLKKISIRENDDSPQHNFYIGLAYLSGIDVEVDHQQALSLITGAAEAGLVEAAEKLVDMYRSGNGVPLDYQKAIQWQEYVVSLIRDNLAETGDPDTAYQLAHQERLLGDYCMELPDLARARDAYAWSLKFCQGIVESGEKAAADLEESLAADPAEADPDPNMLYTMTVWMQAGKSAEMMLPAYYDNLGDVYSALGELEEARQCYEHSLAINRRTYEEQGSEVERHNLVISLQRLGDLYQKTGDYDRAHQYYQELESLFEGGGRLRDRLVMYSKRGDEYKMQDDWEQAEAYYRKQYQLAEQLYAELRTDESREDLAYSYGRMAEVCWSTGRLAEADKYACKNLSVCKEWYENSQSWNAQFAVALAYYHMGMISHLGEDLPKAEENYLKALTIRRQLYRQSQTKQILSAIALNDMQLVKLLLGQGRMKDARSCGIEMYDAAEEAGIEEYMDWALRSLFHIAAYWLDQSQERINCGKNEAALEALAEARELGKYISDKGRTVYNNQGNAVSLRPMAAAIQYNLALAHIHLDHFEQAVQAAYRSGELYTKLLQETGRLDDGESAAQCWEFLGIQYTNRNNSELAVYYFRRALALRQKLYDQTKDAGRLPAWAMDCIRLGNLCLEQQNWKESADCFYQSSNLLLEHFKQTNDIYDLELNCQAAQGLGDICWNTKNYKDAKTHYEDTLDCAIMVQKKSRLPLAAAECGKIFLRLAMICEMEENFQDAMAYFKSAYKHWKNAIQDKPSEVNQDGFARAAFALGERSRDARLLKEAYGCWDSLCAQYPENEVYRQRLEMTKEAMR